MARASSNVITLWVSRATQARALVAVLPFIRTCNPLLEDRTKTACLRVHATFTEAIVATDRLCLQRPMKQDVARDPDLWAGGEQCVRRPDMVNHQGAVLSGHESRILCVGADLTNCTKPRATFIIGFRRCRMSHCASVRKASRPSHHILQKACWPSSWCIDACSNALKTLRSMYFSFLRALDRYGLRP